MCSLFSWFSRDCGVGKIYASCPGATSAVAGELAAAEQRAAEAAAALATAQAEREAARGAERAAAEAAARDQEVPRH